jgi:hypothetical protein
MDRDLSLEMAAKAKEALLSLDSSQIRPSGSKRMKSLRS